MVFGGFWVPGCVLSPQVWNTLGECKYTISEDGHTDWVSCVRFSPNLQNPLIVSGGWDKVVKVSSTLLPASVCIFRADTTQPHQLVFFCALPSFLLFCHWEVHHHEDRSILKKIGNGNGNEVFGKFEKVCLHNLC